MHNEQFKSGFVAIMGRPNVGKSTILNALIGNKISIVSPIPQTTRHQIKGILNMPGAQIVFVDTPGIHSFRDSLVTQLNTVARQSVEGCDMILYVADVSRAPGKEEYEIMKFLGTQKIKIIMALNKMDLGQRFLGEYVSAWKTRLEKKKISNDPVISYLPLSARSGKNIDTLKSIILEHLPVQVPFYDTNTQTDFPLKFRVADIVREKLFLNLKEELPHSLAVEVETIEKRNAPDKLAKEEDFVQDEDVEEDDIEEEGMEDDFALSSLEQFKDSPKGGFMYIKVKIYVNRTSQKKIVIGEKGKLLKSIGTQARKEMETLFSRRVYLDVWVGVLSNWQDKPRILKELGYSNT
ncbi:MAG: GTPase Era [Candidatus Omnitrophota bacterium]